REEQPDKRGGDDDDEDGRREQLRAVGVMAHVPAPRNGERTVEDPTVQRVLEQPPRDIPERRRYRQHCRMNGGRKETARQEDGCGDHIGGERNPVVKAAFNGALDEEDPRTPNRSDHQASLSSSTIWRTRGWVSASLIVGQRAKTMIIGSRSAYGRASPPAAPSPRARPAARA